MSIEERQFLEQHFERQDRMLEEIHRAMYGEPKNEVPGVLARLKTVEIKLKKLFHDRARVIWVGSAFVVLVGAIWELAKLYFG